MSKEETLTARNAAAFSLLNLSATRCGQVRYSTFIEAADGGMLVIDDDCIGYDTTSMTVEAAREVYASRQADGWITTEPLINFVGVNRYGQYVHGKPGKLPC